MDRVFTTPGGQHYFFGYFDKSPFDADSTRLLAMRPQFMDRMVRRDDVLAIGYFDWAVSDQFVPVTDTRAWNWQQGCMLQWLGPEYDGTILFNDRLEGRFVTVIMDLESKQRRILPYPSYTVSSRGDFALCLDFERHYWFREGYHYQGIENRAKAKPVDPDDGIWRLDLRTSAVDRIITMRELLRRNPCSSMRGAIHFVDHPVISPDNRRFLFLHRWKVEDGGISARLYSANVDGSDLYLLNDSGRMSHYCWRNTDQVVGWGGIGNPVTGVRKHKRLARYFIKPLLPLYHRLLKDGSKLKRLVQGDGYLLFSDRSNRKQRVGAEVLTSDGHPSFSRHNADLMLGDTYPNVADGVRQELFLFDLSTGKKTLIDKLAHVPEYHDTGYRADLHPKWSLDGRFVAVDTFVGNHRGMLVYAR